MKSGKNTLPDSLRQGTPTGFSKGRPVTEEMIEQFLIELSGSGDTIMGAANITAACRLAGFDRSAYYDRVAVDPEFKLRADKAFAQGVEACEDALRHRAFAGVDKAVWYKGEQVGSEKIYSDQLGMFLMQGDKAQKYKQRQDVTVNGRLDLQGLSDEELDAAIQQKLEEQRLYLEKKDAEK